MDLARDRIGRDWRAHQHEAPMTYKEGMAWIVMIKPGVYIADRGTTSDPSKAHGYHYKLEAICMAELRPAPKYDGLERSVIRRKDAIKLEVQ
jgi:hypothetical protein